VLENIPAILWVCNIFFKTSNFTLNHKRIFIFITGVVPEILRGVSREQVTEATQSVTKPQ
jgi:hypothetical protein